MSPMSIMSISIANERPGTLLGWLRAVPWLTVGSLAAGMGYADGFWLIALRGTVGSIERTQEPFMTWLRESTLALPVFVLAVLGAVALAARWFRPVRRTWRTHLATALLVVAAGTLVGVVGLAATSAYDYHLQTAQLQKANPMGAMGSRDAMGSIGDTADQQQASLELQERAVAFGSVLLLVSNFVLVGWVVALRGGRLNLDPPLKKFTRAGGTRIPR